MKHEFVEYIPDELDDGVLYVSIPHLTAVHKCACGCGEETVTPISPTDWKLTFDGESVSLSPSIGNWSYKCRSHYWIKDGQVRWAERWTTNQIKAGKQEDRLQKAKYYHDQDAISGPTAIDQAEIEEGEPKPVTRWWTRLVDWFNR